MLWLLHSVLLTINMVFLTCITSRKRCKWEIIAICFLFASILQVLQDARVHATILVFIIALYLEKNLKQITARFINIFVITALYQLVASFYKFGLIPPVGDFSPGQMLLYSIDHIVLLTAIYIDTKGGRTNEEGNPLLDLVYPCIRVTESRSRTENANHETIQLTALDRVLMVTVAILQIGIIVTAVTINDRFWVFLIVYILGFFPQKLATGFNYHADTLVGCTIQSLITFYVACAVVPQVGVSILLPVCAGTAIVVVILTVEHWKSFMH